MAARPPLSRGFTLAEKRSLRFEQIALYAVFLVAVIAAIISFVAMRWVGVELGLGWAAPLVPLAIDGFAIACSAGIVRSQAATEPARERSSEWVGLFLALILSIAGNVQHVLATSSNALSPALKVPLAAAVPILVAFGIHVYGRALTRGISTRVLADDPTRIQIGDLARAAASEARPARTAPARTPAGPPPSFPPTTTPPQRELVEDAPTPAGGAGATVFPIRPAPAVVGDDRARVRALFDAAVAADPDVRPDAAALHCAAGVTKNPATSRRWVADWWAEHQEARGMRPDPDGERDEDGEGVLAAVDM